MTRQIIWLLVLMVVLLAGWYLRPTPANAPTAAYLSQDLYPLYDKVSWNAPVTESIFIGTSTYTGASVTSSVVENTMDPGSVFTPFEQYYDKKLKALGWSVANDLAAGGHVGGQTGYRKGESVILTGFRINYRIVSTSSPSECPCDVSLSLFSTEK